MQKTHADLAGALEGATDAFFILDGGWRFTYLNSRAERVLDRRSERLLGEDLREALSESVTFTLRKELGRAVEERDLAGFRWYHPELDRWFEVRANPLESGVLVCLRDTDESREGWLGIVERALEASAAGALITDATQPHDPIIYANRALQRMTGYTEGEMIGYNCRFLQGTDRDQPELRGLRKAVRFGEDCTCILRNYRKDGTLFYNELYVSPVSDENGNVTHYLGIQNDVTDRVLASERDEETLRQQAAAMQSSMDGIGISGPDGRLGHLNQAHADLYGYANPDEMVGMGWRELYGEDQVSRFERDVVPDLVNEGHWRGEAAGVRKDGSEFPQELSLSVLEDGGTVCVVRDISERRRGEEASRLLSSIVEHSEEAIVANTLDGTITSWNPAAERLFGYTAEEMVGESVGILNPREKPNENLEKIKSMGRTGAPNRQETVRVAKSGERMEVSVTSSPVRDAAGSVTGTSAIFKDISRSKAAERALTESEERYRAIVEDQTEMICRFSPDRTLTFVNESYCRHFGLEREELLGESFMSQIPEEERRALEEHLFSLTRESPARSVEHRITTAGGEVRWHQWTDRALFDERGELTGYQSVGRDITERKEAEEALHRERNLLRTVIDSTRDFIFVKDTEHRFRLSNAAHQSVMGAGSQEELLLGKTNADYWGEKAAAPFHADDRRVLDHGEFIADREEKVYGASGEELWLSTTKAPLQASGGGIEGLVAVSRDITERRREQHELSITAARLTTLIQNMPSGILVEDEERNIRRANAAITRMFEMEATAEELTRDDCNTAARDVMNLLADPEGFVARIEEILASGRAVTGEEVLLADGRVYERDYVPVYVRGEYRGHMWHYRDLTSHKRAEERLRESQGRFRALFDQTAVGVCVADLDRRLLETNEAYQKITGYSGEELMGMSTLELTHPEDRAADTGVSRTFVSDHTDSYRRSKRYIRKDGAVIWAEATSSLVRDEQGQPRFIMGIVEDVTERRKAQLDLAESERLLRTVTSGAPVILFATDPEGVITLSEGKGLDLVGRSPSEDVGESVFETYGDLPEIVDNVCRALNGQEVAATVEVGGLAFETRYSPIRDREGEVTGSIGVATDVSARRELEKELEHRAFHDTLTGLPNRDLFMERLERALARNLRNKQHVAVLFLDLDDFKHVNDSLGHTAGDRLLIEAGQRIQACLRDEDTVARLGGDEFAVLMEEVLEPESTARVAERIAAEIRRPITLAECPDSPTEGPEVIGTLSLGIALSGPEDKPVGAEELLQMADAALYTAKDTGKDHHEVFRQEMKDRSAEVLKTGRDLRLALEREEFILYYQPKIDLSTGTVSGVEALLRWEHPERGLVPPDEFIPHAEDNGLIIPLGRWVLREACRQAKEWQDLGRTASEGTASGAPSPAPLKVNVNVSARQLRSPGFPADVAAALSETGIEPSSLVLEITEGVLFQQDSHGASVLRELRELGVWLAIDDFGSGYSSLSYLKNLAVDVLKIDRSLVSGMGDDPASYAIVSAAVAVAHALGLLAVAEGVEEESELDELLRLGCDFGQGYYWSSPRPADEITAFL
ncbi:PAS domain S-box protein [Rubrobacter aplysinae]|uniref:PAS domain S-box protein n=1 Tax=Rubrobacter aplysinae TaxID=909625 RepID=UPI00069EA678|nr:PAS domain S-box protein [Rubrobacter aplysinae]